MWKDLKTCFVKSAHLNASAGNGPTTCRGPDPTPPDANSTWPNTKVAPSRARCAAWGYPHIPQKHCENLMTVHDCTPLCAMFLEEVWKIAKLKSPKFCDWRGAKCLQICIISSRGSQWFIGCKHLLRQPRARASNFGSQLSQVAPPITHWASLHFSKSMLSTWICIDYDKEI